MKTQTKEILASLTPEKAIDILKEGNKRFVQNLRANRNLLQQVNATRNGQYPFAVVLSCIDSRVPVEFVFDQGIGDLFSVRVAGNIVNEDILGSIEYGCRVAGAKVVVVLGHSSCGAVQGACDQVELGNLTGLLAKIKPAIDAVEEGENKANRVAMKNVDFSLEEIKRKSPVLNQMIEDGEIQLVGAMYSVENGIVSFEN